MKRWFALVAVPLLLAATGRPQVTLTTALPLVWGEGNAADVLAGRSARSPILVAIERVADVRPIDTVTTAQLGKGIAILAQPRRLTPQELVAFDGWVRGGGRAIVFADPELVWPMALPLGDVRRPPPVTLLDPLLTHWKLVLGDSDGRGSIVASRGSRVAVDHAGKWKPVTFCTAADAISIDCRIGKGRVVLVADADLLDARLADAQAADNAAWVVALVEDMAGTRAPAPPIPALLWVAILLPGAVLLRLWYTRSRT